ncbi:MAG: biopolymer transporter ExbD [Candidatus Thiodiazotropha sp. (ex. Lucinisca nassula)]|uniref:Biopolymer transporter ExbD n=1 Tax=Candidatus Thiodiazotropha endoloripes TaxID=1818881 RepID=A0A1E2UTW2_9GAMM|nr:biopolymer transporter ExbD [Candidatus Thiodiazotropha endoloripes]MBV2089606.1 biopolymer transporter ExbD [Candidatus Thiodiazotropha taylori]MBW9262048.1 biopolymer transporter ExbD [Candidatus Thiodiazotropha sp. (ex. Lucinisca nassula)]MCG7897321.1 biopolymer transporter ExbD [Candidatus Thiodiazotropha weberae]MCG7991062.1 biopolymer transporter ExbD [Candidatus Thiodiazotropha lotti]MBW9271001.1 biopolymer transporter ExbD [Candidatus Thiodiazotropha sp. (ex. Lucinisca nassula)]
MRHQHVDEESGELAINLTPLIDMVFILLIFFMVTSSFVKETGVEVDRPSAATATMKQQAAILIGVTHKGEVWIDKRRVDVRAVRANVERLHAENPEGAVVIMADREAPTGVVIRVLDQSRLAGVDSVSIAATRDQE